MIFDQEDEEPENTPPENKPPTRPALRVVK